MQELSNEELMQIQGGANWISGTFLSAINKAANTVFEMGKSLGTAIRRVYSGNVCEL